MSGGWRDNPEATERVKALLVRGGLPLEIRVALLGTKFIEERDDTEDTHVSSERVVYGDPAEQPTLREIDRVVDLYREFEVGEHLGIALHLQIPIECKHRDGVEIFGFPFVGTGDVTPSVPVASDLAPSTLVRAAFETEFMDVVSCPVSAIGLVEIENGETPKRVFEEQIVYKAAAMLYDFIQSGLSRYSGLEASPVIDELGLIEAFDNYLRETHYGWFFTLRKWIGERPEGVFRKFNLRYHKGQRIHYGIGVAIPIVCFNGPTYLATFSPEGQVTGFEEAAFLLASIRAPGWPGAIRWNMIRPRLEAPVLVMNVESLPLIFQAAWDWFQAIADRLRNAPPAVTDRALLEAAFQASAVARYSTGEESVLRSDLWFENLP